MTTVDTTLSARYHLESLLGRGGMADVYRGRDLVLERPVAVKVLRPTDDGDARRFTQEVRTMPAVSHPGIVALFDAGSDDCVPYLVMELVEGTDLLSVFKHGPLDPDYVATIGRALAGALAHAHGLGVVHRDVKPGNVLIDAAGRARLTDFGIARLADATRVTTPGMTAGTAAYLAPEQLTDGEAGAPADVFSLGLVLLEALTGSREYTGTAVEAAMARLQRDPVVPDDLPQPWTPLLLAMTARDPLQRPSARQVAGALSGEPFAVGASAQPTRALDGDLASPGEAELTAPGHAPDAARTAPRPHSQRAVLAAVAVLLITAAALLAFGVDRGDHVPDEPYGPDTTLPAELDDAIDMLERAVRP